MIKSSSSQVAEFGFEPDADDVDFGNLIVKFRTGGSYKYAAVTRSKFQEMQAAESHGSFLHKRIKPYHAAIKLVDTEEKSPLSANTVATNE
jgi:hypothetical protein